MKCASTELCFGRKGCKTFNQIRTHLPDWSKLYKRIVQAEKRSKELIESMEKSRKYVDLFDNPFLNMYLPIPEKQSNIFTMYEDKCLIGLTQKYGYGNWTKIHQTIRESELFQFDFCFRVLTELDIQRRCESLTRKVFYN